MSKSFYKGSCPICNKSVVLYGHNVEADNHIGYIYQGKIKRYFHLACLDSIKRGNTHG